jgi:hypothetical protein
MEGRIKHEEIERNTRKNYKRAGSKKHKRNKIEKRNKIIKEDKIKQINIIDS